MQRIEKQNAFIQKVKRDNFQESKYEWKQFGENRIYDSQEATPSVPLKNQNALGCRC